MMNKDGDEGTSTRGVSVKRRTEAHPVGEVFVMALDVEWVERRSTASKSFVLLAEKMESEQRIGQSKTP